MDAAKEGQVLVHPEPGQVCLFARQARDRAVPVEHLVGIQHFQLSAAPLVADRSDEVVVGGEVAVRLAGLHVREHDAVDELAQAPLALVGADRAAEVLRGDDGGGVDAPEVGELDAPLLEDDLAALPVRLDDVAALPGDGQAGGEVVGEQLEQLLVRGGEVAALLVAEGEDADRAPLGEERDRQLGADPLAGVQIAGVGADVVDSQRPAARRGGVQGAWGASGGRRVPGGCASGTGSGPCL